MFDVEALRRRAMACYATQGLSAEISNYALTYQHSGPRRLQSFPLLLASPTPCTIPIIVGQRRLSIIDSPRVFREWGKSKNLNEDVNRYAEAVGNPTW
jgi:hypothetical protein